MMLAIGLNPCRSTSRGSRPATRSRTRSFAGGRFDVVCAELLKQGILIDYVEAWTEGGKAKAAKKLKVKYSCTQCGINAWAKPDCRFICGDCDEPMEPEA